VVKLTALACEAPEFFIHCPHPRVINAIVLRQKSIIIDSVAKDLSDRHLADLVGVEEAKLDSSDFVELHLRVHEPLAGNSAAHC
jgi:hypothetical protein